MKAGKVRLVDGMVATGRWRSKRVLALEDFLLIVIDVRVRRDLCRYLSSAPIEVTVPATSGTMYTGALIPQITAL